jgi:hypothetical protein
MAVRARASSTESSIARAFIESLQLLGYVHDPTVGDFGSRMFNQSNEKGLFGILHFLLLKVVPGAQVVHSYLLL